MRWERRNEVYLFFCDLHAPDVEIVSFEKRIGLQTFRRKEFFSSQFFSICVIQFLPNAIIEARFRTIEIAILNSFILRRRNSIKLKRSCPLRNLLNLLGIFSLNKISFCSHMEIVSRFRIDSKAGWIFFFPFNDIKILFGNKRNNKFQVKLRKFFFNLYDIVNRFSVHNFSF